MKEPESAPEGGLGSKVESEADNKPESEPNVNKTTEVNEQNNKTHSIDAVLPSFDARY
jgi:hypothetical protein